jgi:hypothetical protein
MYRAIVFRESIGLVIEGPPPFRYVILTYPLRRGLPHALEARRSLNAKHRFTNSHPEKASKSGTCVPASI